MFKGNIKFAHLVKCIKHELYLAEKCYCILNIYVLHRKYENYLEM